MLKIKPATLLKVTRANFLPASIIPFLIGAAFAANQGFHVSLVRFLLGLLAVVAAHLAGNLFNDYFDYTSGADNVIAKDSPFFGGSRAIQEKIAKPSEILLLAIFFGAVSFLCATVLSFMTRNAAFLAIIVICGLLTLEYTAPPLRLAYRRLGEINIFLLFGVFLVMGGFYLFSERFTFGSFLISLPIAFLVAGIILANEVPDFESDVKAGKMNLISVVGQKRGYLLYAAAVVFSAFAVILNIAYGNIPKIAALMCAAYFLGIAPTRILKNNSGDVAMLTNASKMAISLHGVVGVLTVISLVI